VNTQDGQSIFKTENPSGHLITVSLHYTATNLRLIKFSDVTLDTAGRVDPLLLTALEEEQSTNRSLQRSLPAYMRKGEKGVSPRAVFFSHEQLSLLCATDASHRTYGDWLRVQGTLALTIQRSKVPMRRPWTASRCKKALWKIMQPSLYYAFLPVSRILACCW
jgi:hypothetical protein